VSVIVDLVGLYAVGAASTVLVWGPVDTSQSPDWIPVDDSQTSNWETVNTENTVVWVGVPT